MAESECNGRCASISEEDIGTLLCDKDSVKNKKATKVSVGVLHLYLQEKGQQTDFVLHRWRLVLPVISTKN